MNNTYTDYSIIYTSACTFTCIITYLLKIFTFFQHIIIKSTEQNENSTCEHSIYIPSASFDGVDCFRFFFMLFRFECLGLE